MLKPQATVMLPLLAARDRTTRAGRPRVPEPMVMNDEDSVADFHAAGGDADIHAGVHELNTRSMSRLLPEGGRVLDLGVGSGRLAVRLARHRGDVRVTGLDLAERMLATARELAATENVADRVSLRQADITEVADHAPDAVDLVSTNWALHHLPGRSELQRCLEGIAAVRERTGCAVWIFDLQRMRHRRSQAAFSNLVAGGEEHHITIQDGIDSEAAAWSSDELREALADAGLGDLKSTRSTPLPWLQAHWAPGPDAAGAHRRLWQPLTVPLGVRMDAGALRATLRGLPR
jgi:2-polyprenyl-3-methyl-5-hydroxy-6-metoxy-1,4-benzoquinol methylase